MWLNPDAAGLKVKCHVLKQNQDAVGLHSPAQEYFMHRLYAGSNWWKALYLNAKGGGLSFGLNQMLYTELVVSC